MAAEITAGATLLASAKNRFGDSMPDLTDTQVQQILDAVVTAFSH
jgi:hypothetical protein